MKNMSEKISQVRKLWYNLGYTIIFHMLTVLKLENKSTKCVSKTFLRIHGTTGWVTDCPNQNNFILTDYSE